MVENDVTQSPTSYQQLDTTLRLSRRAMRRGIQMLRYKRLSLADVPILFANAFPKSGTHLLTQALDGFTRVGPAVNSGLPAIVTFEGNTGRTRSETEILTDLYRLLPGDIAYGHLHALPQTTEFICRADFAPYFILRDPRDVVVSHVHYVTEMEENHIHHDYYCQVLTSFDERLYTSIAGIPGSLPNIYQRFTPYLGWLDHPEVLTLRFEDFKADFWGNLEAILDHALEHGFPLKCNRESAVRILEESIDPQSSPTFRSGRVGGWQGAFNPEHRHIFKELTGDLLIRLGYEQDNTW
ncbi:MAG: sulfotransferase domain-containing protein [Chloroflexota bacterium]|nr:sulfotransferase domain-containing protein [Chloroflexota bacterium]